MAAWSEAPTLKVQGSWVEILQPPGRGALERLLPDYLCGCRWFGGQTRAIPAATLRQAIPIPASANTIFYNLVLVEYFDGKPELYALPLAFIGGAPAEKLLEHHPHAVLARLHGTEKGVL